MTVRAAIACAPPQTDTGRSLEMARQAAVLAAWRTPLPAQAALDDTQPCMAHVKAARLRTDAAGLHAYQWHARMQARRVLAGAYPTVQAMLGAEALAALADRLWQQSPPTCGDLGEWGGGLAALISATPALDDWPWLADSARLDWACHLSERAADAELDAPSLQHLGNEAPENLRLKLHPGVRVLDAPWPLAGLLAAHRLPETQQAPAAMQALREGERGAFVIWRAADWTVHVRPLPADWCAWMRLQGVPECACECAFECPLLPHDPATVASPPPDLAQALAQAPAGFDFTAWLTAALREGWLWQVQVHMPTSISPERVTP